MAVSLTGIQSEVVNHGSGALLVVAGPGAGKTRVLTERVRKLLAEPDQHFRVLALTFTNKAANEMRERLDDVPGVGERTFIGTIHSFCTEVLSNRGQSVGISGLPHIFESYADRKQVLQDAVNEHPDLKALLAALPDQSEKSKRLDSWLKTISELKNDLQLPEAVSNDSLRRLYEAYNDQLRASDAVDFDDLLLLTYRLFVDRPKIAAFYRRQYRYICIDEAQDLNEAQYRLICALCGTDYKNVMMVGDPKQAIFMWNGAHPKYLECFEQDFSAKRVTLDENFRSAATVVAAAQKLVPEYTVEGILPIEGQVTIKECADEHEEAEYVLARLNELRVQGHPDIEGNVTLERCAVLGRNRFVFSEIETLLKERDFAYYKKFAASAFRSESDVVAEFELALRVVANPLDRLHLRALAERWGLGNSAEDVYGDCDIHSLKTDGVLRLLSKAKSGYASIVLSAIEAVEWTPQQFQLSKGLDVLESQSEQFPDDQRALVLQDIRDWRSHWDVYVRSQPGGHRAVPTFLSHVALGSTQQPAPDGIALLTVHSAKGMEFDIVFVIGMTEGTFPDYRAKGDAFEEEVRNAFVAMTRSRRLLFLTYPRRKMMPWGDVKDQKPSRFLATITK